MSGNSRNWACAPADASRQLRTIDARTKNLALESISDALLQRRVFILEANAIDVAGRPGSRTERTVCWSDSR